ncbi:hypothetical protein F4825DRAFT_469293 [Nemania diffusa]|nr:hypothetical protein F4825DRAFT_469293 [Nemania diffusa]
MWQHGGNKDIYYQKLNTLDLRCDIGYALDAYWFAIVPKQGRYVIHCLTAIEDDTEEFASLFHNPPVLSYTALMRYIPAQYLFARFARAVFMPLKPFIVQSPMSRLVASIRQQDVNPSSVREDGHPLKQWLGWLSEEQLPDQYGDGGTKRASLLNREPEKEKQQAPDDESSRSGSPAQEEEDDMDSDE